MGQILPTMFKRALFLLMLGLPLGAQVKKPANLLQVDLRGSHFTEAAVPSPVAFLRLSYYRGPGLVESISTWNTENHKWFSELALGRGYVTPNLKVYGVILGSKNSDDRVQAMVGTQIFWTGRWGAMIIPVARYEVDVAGSDVRSVAVVLNPNFKPFLTGVASRFSLAPDVTVRKALNVERPTAWNAGAGLRYYWQPKNPVEVGVLRNQLGQWQLRARVIHNFMF